VAGDVSGKPGFWDHYPQRWWQPEDWAKWEQAGRPDVPRELRLARPESGPLGVPYSPSSVLVPPGFRLSEKPSRGSRVDALLDRLGIGRRR
jgi:hypothetical protein